MSFSLRSWWSSSRKTIRRRQSFVPRLLALEERTLPSTLTVTSSADSGLGSLRAAVASAASGDTIVFDKSVHAITLTSGELLITDSVAIKGPGAMQLSVSGNDASRVFEIATGLDVTISGLTVTDGYALEQAGGILNDGSNLTLSGDDLTHNVVVESATNGARGGALRSLAGTLTIADCQITANQALGAAGSSAFGDALGGGIYVLAGSATISDCTIRDNLARGGINSNDGGAGGGGIFATASASLVINNSTIRDNRSAGGDNAPASDGAGGAIETNGLTSISNCLFSGNVANGGNGGTGPFVGEGEGAAIVGFGLSAGSAAAVTISDSTFEDNQAIGGNGGNSGPGQADPGVDESYGTIFNFGGSLTVSGTTFSHNKSVGGNNGIATGTDIVEVGVAEGGAICNEIGASATFTSCTFDDNQAIGGNGNTGSGPVVHAGTGFGAGIFSGFGGTAIGANSLTVTGSTFTQNRAQGGNNNTGTASVAGLVGAGVGAGIMNYLGGSASVSGSVLIHNQARGGNDNTASGAGVVFAGLGAGGGIFNGLGNYNSSGYGALNASVVTVSNCFFGWNQAKGSDGGSALGGGIANVLAATTSVNSSVLLLNQANGGSGAGLGGGAYNDATSTLNLTRSLVALNHANGSPGIGGGVYTLGMFTDPMTFIFGNHASTSGDNVGP